MKFLDQAKVFIRSGDGGAGCISFRREKYVEFGGPDGGDGGCGGDVIVRCVDGLNTLIDYRYQQHFKAGTGTHGMGKNRTGADGPDKILKVPVGTQIFAEDGKTLIGDLTEIGDEIVLAKGGNGGFGNARFKGPVNQSPRHANPGLAGREAWIWLRMKLIADAGLVGLPNAGKSTFLASVSRAKPKIADYPFTTLHPNLGVVAVKGNEFVIADIPGLIEGASEGAGLGHRFLSHVERCEILLHLVDASQDDVVGDWKTIRDEIAAYENGLTDKKEILALNKCDLIDPEILKEKQSALSKASGKDVKLISGATGDGVKKVLSDILEHVSQRNTAIDLQSESWQP